MSFDVSSDPSSPTPPAGSPAVRGTVFSRTLLATRSPLHPGRFLASHFLAPLGLTQEQVAAELGISRRRVNELVRGRRTITPDTALRLALRFGPDAGFWMGLQSAWDLHRLRSRLDGASPPPASAPD